MVLELSTELRIYRMQRRGSGTELLLEAWHTISTEAAARQCLWKLDSSFDLRKQNRPHASTSSRGPRVWPVVPVHDDSLPTMHCPISRASVKKRFRQAPLDERRSLIRMQVVHSPANSPCTSLARTSFQQTSESTRCFLSSTSNSWILALARALRLSAVIPGGS